MAALKGKLELVSGVPAGGMKLEAYNPDGHLVCQMDNDSALLGSYPVDDGCRIHVIDTAGSSMGQFEDVSKVEKFEISQEDYEKRTDSVRAYKERMKMGRFDPELQKEKEEEKKRKAEEEARKIEGMKVGNRCEVKVPGHPTRRGTVQYTGEGLPWSTTHNTHSQIMPTPQQSRTFCGCLSTDTAKLFPHFMCIPAFNAETKGARVKSGW